jgi:ferredoxin
VERLAGLTAKPIIGVGGIRRWQDAAKYLLAGASAVQVCSLAILKGPQVYGELAGGLSRWMDQRGFAAVGELTGLYRIRAGSHRTHVKGKDPPLRPVVDSERCNSCGICVRSCMYGALELTDGGLGLDADACVSCGLCASLCPRDALRMNAPGG